MLSDFISLFFPRCCMACENTLNQKEEVVCLSCLHKLPKTDSHLQSSNFIESKFYGKVNLGHALAFYTFERKSRIQRLIHQLKYANRPEVGLFLGKLYASVLLEHSFDLNYDVLVPVPLHEVRKRERGYNQSEEFGSGLSSVLKIPMRTDLLTRIKKTETQTKKTRIQRWKNVEYIFEVVEPCCFKDLNVLIVDDVITTGSTIESCAQVILNAGAISVGVVAIAAAK